MLSQINQHAFISYFSTQVLYVQNIMKMLTDLSSYMMYIANALKNHWFDIEIYTTCSEGYQQFHWTLYYKIFNMIFNSIFTLVRWIWCNQMVYKMYYGCIIVNCQMCICNVDIFRCYGIIEPWCLKIIMFVLFIWFRAKLILPLSTVQYPLL